MLVKDYRGALIPKEKARRIPDETGNFAYYEMGVSCIKMDDDKWYRTTTGKIVYDYSTNKWCRKSEANGHTGLVNDGSIGFYSDYSKEVIIFIKKDAFVKKTQFDPLNKNIKELEILEKKWNKLYCINEEVALANGFIESLYDGCFYKESDCTSADLEKMKTLFIPPGERNNTYSLDDDKSYRAVLEKSYDENNLKPSPILEYLGRKYLPFTFGLEVEIHNGTVWKRIREPLGFRTCRDGSIEGQEYVSIPMEGGKGLQATKIMCSELAKRTSLSNKCSVHVHFGDVRRDKLYVISLWTLLCKIQSDMKFYFPYSRTNSIREDGKIYAALLPNLSLQVNKLMSIKDEKEFKEAIVKEFEKIYKYLNEGHPPGEQYDEQFVKDTRETIINGKVQKQYCFRVKKFNYTTKIPHHYVQGPKWNKKSRYHWVNLLNLFFAHSRTVEFRIHEATTNFDKILYYILINAAILKYAERFTKVFSKSNITILDIIKEEFDSDVADQITEYYKHRRTTFSGDGGFKPNWKTIEAIWMDNDKTFSKELKKAITKK